MYKRNVTMGKQYLRIYELTTTENTCNANSNQTPIA